MASIFSRYVKKRDYPHPNVSIFFLPYNFTGHGGRNREQKGDKQKTIEWMWRCCNKLCWGILFHQVDRCPRRCVISFFFANWIMPVYLSSVSAYAISQSDSNRTTGCRLNQFCCGYSLRTGTKIIGFLSLVCIQNNELNFFKIC